MISSMMVICSTSNCDLFANLQFGRRGESQVWVSGLCSSCFALSLASGYAISQIDGTFLYARLKISFTTLRKMLWKFWNLCSQTVSQQNGWSQLSFSEESSVVQPSPWISRADLLLCARAVTSYLHFRYLSFPDGKDSELGSVKSLPAWSALLLLDSFAPTEKAKILTKASNLCGGVWD